MCNQNKIKAKNTDNYYCLKRLRFVSQICDIGIERNRRTEWQTH